MADDNGKDPAAPQQMPFAIVTMHKEIESPTHGKRLLVAFQLQGPGGVPLSYMIELPGEVLPLVIQSLEQLIAEYPALTKDLCILGETRPLTAEETQAMGQAARPSGLVDPSGKPIKPGLKVVKH